MHHASCFIDANLEILQSVYPPVLRVNQGLVRETSTLLSTSSAQADACSTYSNTSPARLKRNIVDIGNSREVVQGWNRFRDQARTPSGCYPWAMLTRINETASSSVNDNES